MTQFCIQIHPHRSHQLDVSNLLSRYERLASDTVWIRQFSWKKQFDETDYVNVTFETDHPKMLWNLLYEQFYLAGEFGRFLQISSIATCEGRHGWDDYLLLHHFDAGVKCDRFP